MLQRIALGCVSSGIYDTTDTTTGRHVARANSRKNSTLEEVLIAKAGGRCSCSGQCGHNHAWAPKQPAVRCAAPHGCNVVRKLDNPSCWRLAPLQGFITAKQRDKDMRGPRTHEKGAFVKRGISVDFAFPELFGVDRISQIWLSVVVIDPSKKNKQGKLPMCQFCARNYKELRS